MCKILHQGNRLDQTNGMRMSRFRYFCPYTVKCSCEGMHDGLRVCCGSDEKQRVTLRASVGSQEIKLVRCEAFWRQGAGRLRAGLLGLLASALLPLRAYGHRRMVNMPTPSA